MEEIMKRHIGFILVITLLLSLACNLGGNLIEEIVSDEPEGEATAVAPANNGDGDSPAQPDSAAPTQPGETEGGGLPLPGDYAGLTSYRSRTIITDLDTGEADQSSADIIMQPFAMRLDLGESDMIMTTMGVWMEIPDIGWYEMDFTAEELAMSREEFMALEWGGELEELPDIPPWPSQLFFMPDQAALSLMEGGLTPAGRDNINGIACQKYNIVTNYSYEMEDPVFGGDLREDMEASGSICAADQPDLPAIVIWADISQTATRTVAGQTIVWQNRVEYEITAVNIPLVIEPPSDAIRLDDMFDDGDDGDFDDDLPSSGDLTELDSYRLVMTIHIAMEGYEGSATTTFEWMNEPRAYRHKEERDEFTMEWIGVGGKTWMRISGGDWTEIESEEEPDLTGSAYWHPEDGAELLGTAIVNGVNCRHYRYETIEAFGAIAEGEAWVADEAGLPVIIIRSLMQTSQEGQITTTEINVYDINQPLNIEPPR
jgi:hypothetical protein